MAKKSAVQQQQQQQSLQLSQQQSLQHPPDTLATAAPGQQPKLEDLVWMRDKFASGLQNLESGVRELRLAYLNHFNSLLPEGHPSRLDPPFVFSGATTFGDAIPPSALQVSAPPGAPPAGPPGNNQKRKRKPHDPNAPKRALTSYFLFMQTTKPLIKAEHPEWAANQISEESERRWANIDLNEKQRYEYMYNVDLARYYKQKEEYDAGRPIPEIDQEEALRLYEEHLRTGNLIKGRKGRRVLDAAAAAGQPVSAAATAGAESSDDDDNEGDVKLTAPLSANDNDEADGDDDDESEEEHAPPPKSKKQKTNRSTPAKPVETPKRKIESEKKGRGKKGKATAEAEASENSPIEEATPAADKKKEKKSGGRKRKSTGEK